MRLIFKNVFGGALACVMMGSAAPSAAQVMTTPPEARPHTIKVKFKFPPNADRKPVPFELVKGILVFRAKLNGQMVWAILDNGMDRSVIDTQFTSDQNIAVGPIVSPLLTPSASVERRVALNVPIELPGQVSLIAPFSVVDLSFLTQATGRSIAMVVGREYFANLTFVILPDRKTFEVWPSGMLKISTNIPFAPIEDDRARVQVDVGGRKLSLLVDLGANGQLLLSPEAWTRVGLDNAPQTQSRSAGLDGKFRSVAHAILPVVTIGPFVKDHVLAARQPTMLHEADGYVGLGFLANFNFVLDVRRRKLWLLAPSKKAESASALTP